MANFQLGSSRLFPKGARFFVKGNSSDEQIVIHKGKRIALEVAGLARSAKPSIEESVAGVVDVSAPKGTGSKRVVTIEGKSGGKTVLTVKDADGTTLTPTSLQVFVGDVQNHSNMQKDLIAEVFKGSDPAKAHALNRMLHNNDDNKFNEFSADNQSRWCTAEQLRRGGCLPCGTVAKVGGIEIFYRGTDYTYSSYYKRLTGMGTASARSNLKREDLKYEEATLKRGRDAIKKRLGNGIPVVVGLAYIPSSAVQANGSISYTSTGGHSVLIVGCDANAEKFLYIDPYPKGSKLKYGGGRLFSADPFPDVCNYLGIFEYQDVPGRGKVLRSTTPGDATTFQGDQYLEVVAGPLN